MTAAKRTLAAAQAENVALRESMVVARRALDFVHCAEDQHDRNRNLSCRLCHQLRIVEEALLLATLATKPDRAALDAMLAAAQARCEELKVALTKVDEIACRSISAAGFGDEPPEPANRDGEELAMLSRAALARTDDQSALKEFGHRCINRATSVRDDFRCTEGYAVVDAVLRGES